MDSSFPGRTADQRTVVYTAASSHQTRKRPTAPRYSRVLEKRSADPGVEQRAAGGDDEGHEIGQRRFPRERRGPLSAEQRVAMVDREQQRADDRRDDQRATQHRWVTQRASPAPNARLAAGLELEDRAGLERTRASRTAVDHLETTSPLRPDGW